ncbi:MAG: hypothetical protein HYY18_23670 [Planctomycetes bacterium]|nr:hypothetical protein [Planctomycetota bacterium]
MIKRVGIGAAVFGFLAMGVFAQTPPDPKVEWPKKWDALSKKVAREHITLAKFGLSKKLFEVAFKEYTRAAALDGENAEAQKGLGRKLENGVWVDDPAAKVKKLNEGPVADQQVPLAEYESKKKAATDKAMKEFEGLADWCEKNGLKDEAKQVWKTVLDGYNADHERARLAHGWIRDNGRWVSPEDVAKREAGAKKVAGASEGEPVTAQSDVEQRTGWKLVKRKSDHFYLEGNYSDAEMIELVKACEAARSAFLETFELDVNAFPSPIHGIFLHTQQEYELYVDKDPAIPERDKKSYKAFAGYPTYRPMSFVGWQGGREFAYMKDYGTHETIHLMFWQWAGLKEIPAWIFEGLAYWFTDRLLKTALAFCIAMETSAGGGRAFENVLDWKNMVKVSIKDGSDPDIRETMEGRLNTLSIKKAIKAWSLVDFMLTKNKAKFFSFIADLRSGKTQEEALKNALGIKGYGELDAIWEKYVVDNY